MNRILMNTINTLHIKNAYAYAYGIVHDCAY
jgi:hypothetical protein